MLDISGPRRDYVNKTFSGVVNGVPPSTIMTRGNADTVAFPQIGLQRNEQSRK